jgi:hexosaminidase
LAESTGREVGQGLFPYSLLHLGGDEVSYSCWESSPHIQKWKNENGFSDSEDIYEYFVDKVATISRNQKRTPVQWVEVFEHFGSKLDNNTIIHIWKEKSSLDSVVSAGTFLSYFRLDHYSNIILKAIEQS